MELHVTNVAYAGQVHYHALEAETEAGVTAASEAAQVEVPATFSLHFPKIQGVKVEPETIQMTAHVDYTGMVQR